MPSRSGTGSARAALQGRSRPTHRAVPPVLLAVGGVAVLVGIPLPAADRVLLITAAQVGFAVVTLAGLAWVRPARPAPWWVILTGGALYGAAWHAQRLGLPTAVVVGLCCAAFACVVALMHSMGGQPSDHARLEWFDIALLAVAVGAVAVHLPDLLPSGRVDARASTWVSLQAAGTTVLAALGAWVHGVGRRGDAGLHLLLGVLGGLLAWHGWTFVLHVRGGYAPGAVSDVLVIGLWAALAAAMWHPHHAQLGRPSPPDPGWVPSSFGTVAANVVLAGVTLLSVLGTTEVKAAWTVSSVLLLAALLVAREGVARRNTARAAAVDPLTGLGNRTALLRELVRHLARPGDRSALLCLVDVVDFARVNEHRGHQRGDQVLRALARRLVLECAGAGVYRLSGDTFAVVVPRALAIGGTQHPVTLMMLRALAKPFVTDSREAAVEVSVTIGEALVVPLSTLDQDDPVALDEEAVAVVQRAELALADARSRGAVSSRATLAVIERHQRQRRLVAELEAALVRGEVVPHYQAQVDLRTGLPVGVEALARWDHPVLGVLSPAELLPVAEQLGVLDRVDDAVLHQSLRDLAGWRSAEPTMTSLRVSVNASASSLRRPDVVDQVVGALTAAGLPGSALELEITESASLENRAGLEATLEELQDLGVSIAVDDFGSGYASMDYLVRFRADTIKVDRSLVRRVDQPTSARMLAALVDLVHDLGALILAEGTEDDAAVDAVRALGFDVVQGYAHGRPGPAAGVLDELRRISARASATSSRAGGGG